MTKSGTSAGDPEYLQRLGQVVAILNDSQAFHYSVAAVMEWTSVPSQLGQIAFCTTPGFAPVAYMTWAYLSEEVSERMAAGEIDGLHFSEWNEGSSFWIIDLVSMVPLNRVILHKLMQEAGVARGRAVNWLRQRPNSRAKSYVYRS